MKKKTNKELAKIATFWTMHEREINKQYKKFIKDTGEDMPLVAFVDYIYHNAQDLVTPDPSLN